MSTSSYTNVLDINCFGFDDPYHFLLESLEPVLPGQRPEAADSSRCRQNVSRCPVLQAGPYSVSDYVLVCLVLAI